MSKDDLDPELRAALDAAESSLQGVVARFPEVRGEKDDDVLMLAAAAYGMGFEDRRRRYVDGIEGFDSETVRLMSQAITAIDEHAINADGADELLKEARTALAVRAGALRTQFLESVKEHNRELLGERGAEIMTRAALDDNGAAELAFIVLRVQPVHFYGYVMHHDDPKLECRCTSHCAVAFMKNPPSSTEGVNRVINTKFGGHDKVLVKFGHWFHASLRKTVDDSLAGTAPTTHADASEAIQTGNEFLASLMNRKAPE